jgi:hypothetical protein
MIALQKNDKIYVVVLFIVSLLIRVGVFHGYLSKDKNYWQVDSQTYHLVAQGIAEGKGIGFADGSANFYRLPGYPLFVAFFYKLFGQDPVNALWPQVILASIIPILIFMLSLVLFPRRRWLAYVSSAYSSAHLGLVLYSGFFMTESLFIFLFLLFALFFFRNIHLWFCKEKMTFEKTLACRCHPDMLSYLPDDSLAGPSYTAFSDRLQARCEAPRLMTEADHIDKGMLFAGLFLGLASLVRPVGHYLLVLSVLVLCATRWSWWQKARAAAVLSVAWLVPVSIWLIRNYILLGHLFFHTLPGGHFLYLSASRVVMEADDTSYVMARVKLAHEANMMMRTKQRDNKRPVNEIERCVIFEQVARKHFLSHPLITLKLWMTDMFRTCFSLYSAELLYLDSNRQEFDYFNKNRTWWSFFERYLFPQTDNQFLKTIIYIEIALFLFILLGFLFGLMLLISNWSHAASFLEQCSWYKVLPYMALFVVISLAGGYARMRLPIEPFLIILSWYGWGRVFGNKVDK